MKLKAKAKPKIVLAAEVKDEGVIQAHKNGLLLLQVEPEDRELAKEFLQWFFSKKNAKDNFVTVELQKWYQKRTLSMNNLIWALLSIMSWEVYEEFGHEDSLYQDMLDLYAPKIVSRLTGKARNLTSSQMDTAQASIFIEGIFRSLAEIGVGLDSAQAIGDYWLDWYKWRSKQEVDPMREAYSSTQDFRANVCYCEACRRFLKPDEGEVAHIVSLGSGGVDYSWNLLRLCTKHHIMTQHQKGWGELLEEAPHLRWRVERAREEQGKKQLTQGAKNE